MNARGWSKNTTTMPEVYDDLLAEFSAVAVCTLVVGRQGMHSGGLFQGEFVVAQPREMVASSDTANSYRGNVTFYYTKLGATDAPISRMRFRRLLGRGAFDGDLADRLGQNISAGMGEWATPENMRGQCEVILPSTIACQGKVIGGDVLDSLACRYRVDDSTIFEETVSIDNCDGEVTPAENGFVYYGMEMVATS